MTTAGWRSLYPFQSREGFSAAIATTTSTRAPASPGAGPRQPHLVVLLARIGPGLRGPLPRAGPGPHRLRAFGQAGRGSYSYRLAQRVADLGERIEQLDLRQITLVGHDWGGAIGMGAAVAAPERFARFVLMNTAAFRDAIARGDPPCRVPLSRAGW